MTQLRILCAVLLAFLAAGTIAASVYAVNDTPNSDRAALFEPCAFDVGSDAGPLQDSSSNQGYTYALFANEQATLGQFARLVRSQGVLQIGSHGSAISFLVECYPGTGSGRAARDAAFADYVSGTNLTGKNPDGLMLAAGNCIQKSKGNRGGRRYWLVGPQDRKYHAITIRDACIRQLTALATNAPLIVAGSCNSWGLRDDFLNVREFFGYDAVCSGSVIRGDTRLLLQRMDGRAAPRGLARPVHGGAGILPDGSQTAFGLGGFSAAFSHLGPGNTTLAPIVHSSDAEASFAPQGRVPPGSTAPGWVIFDTNMETTVPPALILSVQQNSCAATLENIRWTGTNRLDFDVVVGEGSAEGSLLFAVRANTALSANNQVLLDGNQAPSGQNGVAPNGDDFQWEVSCDEAETIPEVVFQQAGQPAAYWTPAIGDSLAQLSQLRVTQSVSVAVVETELLILGEPGNSASGIFQLENQGLEPELVFFEATDLQMGTAIIPSTTLSIQPSFGILAPESRTPIVVAIAVPPLQPSGVYSGAIKIFTGSPEEQSISVRFIANQTPKLSIPGPQTIVPGQMLTLTVTASDGDGEPILLFAEPLPDGDAETVASFIDNGDGSASFSLMPEANMGGTTLSIPIIASNPYPFDPDFIDGFDFPPHIPHDVQEVTITILEQLYLPLVSSG